ncbi:CGGC domain-containing protein [Methanocaldococcus sp. 28A]
MVTKIAILRCDSAAKTCPAVGCVTAALNKKDTFKDYEDIEFLTIITCGGCPGRLGLNQIKQLIEKYGLEVVHFATCMSALKPKCRYAEEIKEEIEKMGAKVVIGSHF